MQTSHPAPNSQALCVHNFHAMGSPCCLQFYAATPDQAQRVATEVQQRIQQLEQRYSRYLPNSIISLVNSRAGTGCNTAPDPETFALLRYAEQCYTESEGLFDVTSGVLRQIWHFNQLDTTLPTQETINALLPLIGWEKVQWSAERLYLPVAGMELDFGGIVKEYAADLAANVCLSLGITSGVVELGGDLRIIGAMPDGRGWPVAIRDPRQPERTVAQLELTTGALASSGDYERFQIINGVRYSHLLNPKTGWPVSGLRAVSVIADQCVIAGSLATIAMLKAHTGLGWLKSCGLPFLACRNNGKIINHLFST